MSHIYKLISVIKVLMCLAQPANCLSRQSSLTSKCFRSMRTLGVALIVIATLLSTVDANALTRSKATKYGTLSFTIHNLDGNYKPGEQYTIDAKFAANDKVLGTTGWKGYMIVTAGGRALCRQTVIVRKSKTTSTSGSFTAPSDGSTLKITFCDGFKDKDVIESYTIHPIKEDVVKQEDKDDASTKTDEESSNDTSNGSESTNDDAGAGSDNESTNDDAGTSNADEENSDGDTNSQDEGFLSGLLDNDVIKAIQDFWADDPLGLDREATPEEAVGIGSVAALLAALLGGAGAVGGGVGGALGGLGGLGGGAAGAAGGSVPPPIEGPGGPSSPYKSVEDKYVTRYTDGSITVKDPVTGEERLYLPDGQGGYDNPLGGGYQSEEAMLDHLAMLDRNSELLSQDAATAAKNQAEQHAQFVEQAKHESAEAAEYREWKANEERKEAQIIKLADKYGVEANEEAVKRAIKIDQIKAGIESAKQQAVAADKNVTVVGLESTKNVAATSLVLIPMALSGVGTVSAATMAKAKVVQSCYTMASSVTDKVGDAYVKGGDLGKAAVHGVVTGTVGVAQNYAGEIGGKVAKLGGEVTKKLAPNAVEVVQKLVPNAAKLAKQGTTLGTEAAVVIGGEGVKEGLDEYNSSGDLKKTLDATIKGVQKGAVKHAVNKTLEFGLDKGKELIKSRTPSPVASARAKADDAAKTVTAGQQAVSRSQGQVTTAKQRVTTAQQNATRSQQQVNTARGKLNTANEQLNTANSQMVAAREKLGQARTPAEVSRAQAELTTAQQSAAVAQQNVNRANSDLQMAQRVDRATQRVAQHAENDLQKAQFGAQKAQSDLQKATAQHQQALRDAYAAEQQAQVDQFNEKLMAHMSGNDIVGGLRAVEEHLENIDKIDKNNK